MIFDEFVPAKYCLIHLHKGTKPQQLAKIRLHFRSNLDLWAHARVRVLHAFVTSIRHKLLNHNWLFLGIPFALVSITFVNC
jgi:hypothetical protein